MALAALHAPLLSQHAGFCPPPLHIQKKPRRATYCKGVFRKSSHRMPAGRYTNGPLDDIIDEIRNGIRELPLDFRAVASSLELPLNWSVTPLPVSQLPSNQPLILRKNRESRSSASCASMGDHADFGRQDSQDDTFDGGPVGHLESTATTPWPLLDVQTSYDSANSTDVYGAAESITQNAQGISNQVTDGRIYPTKRRPSVLRLFTGLSRLRRTGTNETSGSRRDTSNLVSPTLFETTHDNLEEDTLQEPSVDAVEAYMRRNARNGANLGSIMSRIARRLPSPTGYRHEDQEGMGAEGKAPTTLRAAVRVFSEIAQLSKLERQEFWIAVEVEGALYNRVALPDGTLDVIFVVDNAYYVSRECLSRALDAVNSALYHLDRGDRVALYTTHCTHQSVTGNRPDSLFPIGPFISDTEAVFRDLTASVAKCGSQAWMPPRPNPSMAEVILSIARSLKNKNLKSYRTHVILLSPAAHVLHDLSKSYPDLFIHLINPAPLPYHRLPSLNDAVCAENCCKNVFINNWNHLQTLPSCIKRILKYARSESPVGETSKVSIDLRTKDGCEVIEVLGSKDIAGLRLGQVHTVFAKLRTIRSATKEVDLLSKDPVFNSSLDIKTLRQQLQNSVAVGAANSHLLDIQILHQNTLHGSDCWNYTQTPFIVVNELGGLAPPFDTAAEVLKRRLFHTAVEHGSNSARSEAEILLQSLEPDRGTLKRSVQRLVREIDHYEQVLQYEQKHRQKLPLCPGPIILETSPHGWLEDVWNRKMTKRQDVAMLEEEISGLIDGLHGLERLG